MPQSTDVRQFNSMNKGMCLLDRVAQIRAEKASKPYSALESSLGVNRYYLWMMLNKDGYKPPFHIQQKLGIEASASVVVIAGAVPEGSQALYALRCECGQYFIPNHPRRLRCFLCSPFRKAGKHETQPT